MEARSDKALVNWTYRGEKVAGDPTGNHGLVAAQVDKRSGEQTLQKADIAIPYQENQADILLIPQSNAQVSLTGQGGGEWEIRSRSQSAWWAGDMDWDSSPSNPHMSYRHELQSGAPIVATESHVKWHIEGDVTLYVWGPNVITREPDSEEQSFRSGIWRTDHVGDEQHPGGVAWDQHYQFLRIELTNANLTLNHQNGPAMWTAEELTSKVNGTISYAANRGFLQSTQFEYGFDDELVTLEGNLTQRLSKRAGVDAGIRALVEGSASVDLPPSKERTTAAESRPLVGESQAGGITVHNSFEPRGGVWINTWLLLLITVLIVVAMSKDTIKQQNIFQSKQTLISKSMELETKNPKKALKMAKMAVRKGKEDVAAWNNYAIHLMDLGRHKTVLAKMKPVAEKLNEAVLTYHIACALADDGADDDEILEWLEKLIEQDPGARNVLTQEYHFKRLHNHPKFRRLATEPDTEDGTTAYV